AFNFDGRSAADITIGAVGADRWEVDIRGKASHAGVYPERGISATMIAALAMAEVYRGGWFGKVVKEGREGTSNVGPLGDANGKPTATFGAGQNDIHTVQEWVDVPEFLEGCRLAVELATED